MPYQLQNATVLIIDDMAPMLALVSSILKIFGFKNIHTAQDPEEGFELLCAVNPDIVITDWLMKPYDGIELIKKIRTDKRAPNRFVPIILMTGYSHRVRIEKARDCGVTEILVKPFTAKDLYHRIEHLIEKPRKFVELSKFFGPDRRRRKPKDYQGPMRRDVDAEDKKANSGKSNATDILVELRNKAENIVDKT
jgi:two-component system chemotaxis response regulator CheY